MISLLKVETNPGVSGYLVNFLYIGIVLFSGQFSTLKVSLMGTIINVQLICDLDYRKK